MPNVHFRLFLTRCCSHVLLYCEIRQRSIKHVSYPNVRQTVHDLIVVIRMSIRIVRDYRFDRIKRGIFKMKNLLVRECDTRKNKNENRDRPQHDVLGCRMIESRILTREINVIPLNY